jgi:hypothetical protein
MSKGTTICPTTGQPYKIVLSEDQLSRFTCRRYHSDEVEANIVRNLRAEFAFKNDRPWPADDDASILTAFYAGEVEAYYNDLEEMEV